jgi:hypothetical protein
MASAATAEAVSVRTTVRIGGLISPWGMIGAAVEPLRLHSLPVSPRAGVLDLVPAVG